MLYFDPASSVRQDDNMTHHTFMYSFSSRCPNLVDVTPTYFLEKVILKPFFSFYFVSKISRLIWHLSFWEFTSMFITFIWREPCLKTFKQALVFILCQKTGRFLLIFHNYFSRFHKMKSRTYIKILRNCSLQMNVL